MTVGILMDNSGLSRQRVRERLLEAQGGLCACCGAANPTEADHDHETGLLRGILCGSCNKRAARWESRFCRNLAPFPAMELYLANPPGITFTFMWDLPDWWSPSDTGRLRELQITACDYVSSRLANA